MRGFTASKKKELEGVVGERDILGAQLIRRNEEHRWYLGYMGVSINGLYMVNGG